MQYEFRPDNSADMAAICRQYAQRLTGPTDDFWEAHILGAQLYRICAQGREVGRLAVHGGDRATLFDLEPARRADARALMGRAISELGVRCAFAPTCDEPFLTLCLEHMTSIAPQACLFDGAQPPAVRPAQFGRECLRRISPDELERANRLTNDFFRDDATRDSLAAGKQFIYALEQRGQMLGYGIIVPMRTRPLWACGMVTLSEHRRRGVGRSMQLHLGDICREHGHVPVSGCWYHNALSRRTIESAGRPCTTLLMDVRFDSRTVGQ